MKALALTIALVSSAAFAAPVAIKDSKVTFKASAKPGFLRINGEGGHLTGTLDDTNGVASGTVTVKLFELKTGVGLRDEHMKEKYLEIGKFPEATLKLQPAKYVADKPFDWTGDLTLKGETKPVHGTATVSANKKLTAEFTLSLKDYPAVGSPSYNAIQVGDDVKVSVEAWLQ